MSVFAAFLRPRASSNRDCARRLKFPVSLSRRLRVEHLEDKRMLTTLFVDFGQGVGVNGALVTTAGELFEVAGPGDPGQGTGPIFPENQPPETEVRFSPFQYDFDGLNGVTNADIDAFADAVLPWLIRTLEPFDIDIQIVPDATSLSDVTEYLNPTDGIADAYVFAQVTHIGATHIIGGGAAHSDLFAQEGNRFDEAAYAPPDDIHSKLQTFHNLMPGTETFNQQLAKGWAALILHEAFHTFSYAHTEPSTGQMEFGDVMWLGFSQGEPSIVTRFDLIHDLAGATVPEPNNYLLAANGVPNQNIAPVLGLRDDDEDGIPNLAYVTGTGEHDRITITLNSANINIADVTVEVFSDPSRQTLIAMESYTVKLPGDINPDTEGTILIDASVGDDLILIDSSIAAAFRIRGGSGNDTVRLIGNSTSELQSFSFEGEAGDDTLEVDFQAGDPLPQPGFNFSFDGGEGINEAVVIEQDSTPRAGFFVNSLADATDDNVGDGRAETADGQTTLRAAIEEANGSTERIYVFLPNGSVDLSIGTLNISGNMTIIGSGPGASIVNGGGQTGIDDTVLYVTSGATLDLSRTTVTGGHGWVGGGVRIMSGSVVNLTEAAIVGNFAEGKGGGINTGGTVTVSRSVITGNSAMSGGGVATDMGMVYFQQTIIANNEAVNTIFGSAVTANRDVDLAPSNAMSLGGNLLTSSSSTAFMAEGDLIEADVDFVITTVTDDFSDNHLGNPAQTTLADLTVLSIREAVHKSNEVSGEQKIWLPAWTFVLTRARDVATQPTDVSASFGDLDVGDLLEIRGIASGTRVEWRKGVVDAVFDLIGDFNGDNVVDGADYTKWQADFGVNGDSDADDDGDSDGADYLLWQQKLGNSLSVTNVTLG